MNLRHLLLTGLLLCQQAAMAIEEPAFKVISKSGSFEIRQYAAMLVAETMVEGDMDEASNRGFRRIADYIFGNNQAAQGGTSAKIAMTAPVTVEPQSEKIAMTAPVTVSAAGSESVMTASQGAVYNNIDQSISMRGDVKGSIAASDTNRNSLR